MGGLSNLGMDGHGYLPCGILVERIDKIHSLDLGFVSSLMKQVNAFKE